MKPICERQVKYEYSYSIYQVQSPAHQAPHVRLIYSYHAQLTFHICEELSHHSSLSATLCSYTMLRSFLRAAPSSPSIRGPSVRTALRNTRTTLPICTSEVRKQQIRSVAAHAISNPTLSQIEKRWEGMPPQEQADLWMALRDRMKNDWHELTLQERKAGK